MIYYAIRHIPTGHFLPSGRKRGFTHDEPIDWKEKPPRLHIKKQNAQAALRWWLEGKTTEETVFRGSAYEEAYEDREQITKKVESRKKEDMQVVRLALILKDIII